MPSTFAIMAPVRRGNGDADGQPRIYLLIECPGDETGFPGTSGVDPADRQALQHMVSTIPLADIVSRLRTMKLGDIRADGPAKGWERPEKTRPKDRPTPAPEAPKRNALGKLAIASHRAAPNASDAPAGARHYLTARQYEILMALKNGASNKEIGRRLGILESTVKVQLKSIYRELRVKNRTQAAMLVAQQEESRRLHP